MIFLCYSCWSSCPSISFQRAWIISCLGNISPEVLALCDMHCFLTNCVPFSHWNSSRQWCSLDELLCKLHCRFRMCLGQPNLWCSVGTLLSAFIRPVLDTQRWEFNSIMLCMATRCFKIVLNDLNVLDVNTDIVFGLCNVFNLSLFRYPSVRRLVAIFRISTTRYNLIHGVFFF